MEDRAKQVAHITQEDIRKDFDLAGTEPWTIVWQSREGGAGESALFAALTPPSIRTKVVAGTSWDLRAGGGLPGFMQSHAGDEIETTYLRFGDNAGVEPIVHVRDFHGVKSRYCEVSEEFRHFHDLFDAGSKLVRIGDDGAEEVAAEITSSSVRIKTKYLRQFQAARQLDLVLFIDAVRSFDVMQFQGLDLQALRFEQADTFKRAVFVAVEGDSMGKPFSRYLGKKVLPPPDIQSCGVWPYEEKDNHFPEFIIGEDQDGKEVRFACDPDRLANYFGANAEAPQYLTPVFFSRDVLRRYYEEPEKFSVEDGYLRCVGLWGVSIDNDSPDCVAVFLGDIGRDMPAKERDYWKAFNISPPSGLSETAIRRSFLAQFAEAKSPDIVFRHAYERFAEEWNESHGWSLLRGLHEADRHLLQRVRIPLTESLPEFESCVLNLARLLTDALNDKELKARIQGSVPEDAKSLVKLEMWLTQERYPHLDRDMRFLRLLQQLRSRAAAHLKGSDYEKLIRDKMPGDGTFHDAGRRLLTQAATVLEGLADYFDALDDTGSGRPGQA